VGLEKKVDEMVSNLSGGQQQRVAIARALANLPGLILADEPTGNLDAKASKEVMDVIRTVNENQDITTVVVTHDPKVAAYAQRVYYLDDGRLRATVI
jgi:ABC-type lipoprotein export system ATPase subunit